MGGGEAAANRCFGGAEGPPIYNRLAGESVKWLKIDTGSSDPTDNLWDLDFSTRSIGTEWSPGRKTHLKTGFDVFRQVIFVRGVYI